MNQKNLNYRRKGQVMLKIYMIKSIWCHHHEKIYISRCESLQSNCCDPFKLHKKKISKGLRKTDSELVSILKIKPVLRKLRFMMTILKRNTTVQMQTTVSSPLKLRRGGGGSCFWNLDREGGHEKTSQK